LANVSEISSLLFSSEEYRVTEEERNLLLQDLPLLVEDLRMGGCFCGELLHGDRGLGEEEHFLLETLERDLLFLGEEDNSLSETLERDLLFLGEEENSLSETLERDLLFLGEEENSLSETLSEEVSLLSGVKHLFSNLIKRDSNILFFTV
jgi:hypothetical protein